ncbi:putative flippase GtrA [Psychromicrobium silvestre]|uniref:Putative flippase GtrA n=1 Tax=Psychromicrobium silvestre TaxID=1645614 RepID=A0A7Y9LSC1_9MICC|nr:GtrA family protein [Psychromicrobium silvestre]NYE94704.1 putative flippase GtrA [Psychromicrobium silvestre]
MSKTATEPLRLRQPRPAALQRTPANGLWRQIGSFLVVGAICTVASLAIFAALRPFAGTQWANLVALVLTSILNTELNRRHSWGIQDRKHWWTDHRRGLWVMLLALALTSSSLWLLHAITPDPSVFEDVVTITIANVLAAATRFLLLRYWIFRRVRQQESEVLVP